MEPNTSPHFFCELPMEQLNEVKSQMGSNLHRLHLRLGGFVLVLL